MIQKAPCIGRVKDQNLDVRLKDYHSLYVKRNLGFRPKWLSVTLIH
ncbi:MAG: hypothetical protein V1921_02535 [Candidatus Altiarchaeota archaeon]